MASLTTSQVFKLIGAPNRGVLWGLLKRFPDKLHGVLLHVQHGRGGSLWKAEAVPILKAIYEAQRAHFPWRQWKASRESQLRHLGKLDPRQRDVLEKKLAALEAEWVKETDERRRAALEADLRYLRRVKKRDDRRKRTP